MYSFEPMVIEGHSTQISRHAHALGKTLVCFQGKPQWFVTSGATRMMATAAELVTGRRLPARLGQPILKEAP
jgi:hypothetical protein